MNIRDVLSKLDALSEGLTMQDVQAAVQGMSTDQERASALAALATKNQLGGLYDPVSGSFVGANGQISSTADKNTDFKLSDMGLIPSNAHTSTLLGRIFGTSGSSYDKQLRAQSGKVNADRTSQQVNQANLQKLYKLLDQLKASSAAAPATPAATKESFEFARQLAESFGYQLDELANTMSPDNPNAAFADLPGAPKASAPGDFGEVGNKLAQSRADSALERGRAASGELQNTMNGMVKTGAGNATNDAQAALKARLKSGNGIAKQTAGLGTLPAAEKEIATNLAAKNIKAVAPEAGKMLLAKGGGKMLSKIIPGIGLVVGTADAIDRAKKGDYLGAGMAGLSAVLSLGGPLTAAASMGLDAANMARDYKATGSAFGGAPDKNAPAGGSSGGHPAGGTDAKLAQLQKVIGANPDGKMGPETSAKLKAWQQSQGIAADGMPGPETYGKAGIAESAKQSVAESIRDMQARLELIEAKSVIKESLAKEYFLDESCFIYDENGDYVTDLMTIAAINESAEEGSLLLNEANWLQGIGKGLSAGWDALKGAGGAVKTAARASNAPAAATRLANTGKDLSAVQKGALKTGAAIGRNPVKAALGATALGAGAGLALGGNGSGGAPATVTGGHGGSGGSGGSGGTPTTPTTTPPTPEQQALIDQIKQVMGTLADVPDATEGGDAGISRALQDAQTAIDTFQKDHPAAPADVGGGGMKPPLASGLPADVPGSIANITKDVTSQPTVYKNGGGAGAASNPAVKAESVDDELSRWLKIARG